MLTADHIRIRKPKDGVIELNPLHGLRSANVLDLAERLVEVVREHRGRSQRELTEALTLVEAGPREAKMKDALCKLLDDSSQWSEPPKEPAALRLDLFRQAARARADGTFDRAALLRRHGIDPDAAERALYADLPEHRRLLEPSILEAKTLVERFDHEQARALLLVARSLTVRVPRHPAAVRRVVQRARFFGLLATAQTHDDEHVAIHLSGPASEFAATHKYGVAFANLLPHLDGLPHYQLDADVVLSRVTRGRFTWQAQHAGAHSVELPSRDNVVALSTYLRTHFDHVEDCAEMLLGSQGTVLIPDLTVRHRGIRLHLELLENATPAQLDVRSQAWPASSRELVVCYRETAAMARCRKDATPWMFAYKRQLTTKLLQEFLLRFFS